MRDFEALSSIEVALADFSSDPRKNWDDIFASTGPLKVEICSGKDEFLIRMAEREPQSRFVGIERSLAVSKKLIEKIERSRLPNIRVVREPAEYVLEDCFRPDEIAATHINFPDPWPKKRHFKRRLIQPKFVELMADRLAPGGTLQFVSDHEDYVRWSLEIFEQNPRLQNLHGPSGLALESPDYPPTLYMKKYQREGRRFHFLRFAKRD